MGVITSRIPEWGKRPAADFHCHMHIDACQRPLALIATMTDVLQAVVAAARLRSIP